MRIIIFVLVVLLSANTTAGKIFAHTLETTDSIGAILHIHPNDQPIAGTTTQLTFEVTDTSGHFDPEECYCSVVVSQNDTVLDAVSLLGYSQDDGSTKLHFEVVFPEAGVYDIQLAANPKDWKVFPPFRITYSSRVEEQQTDLPTQFPFALVLLPTVAVSVLVLGVIIFIRKSKILKRNT